MSTQPLKLNYAKARQKSKTKNEPQSQDKIAFQSQSSTDIFAHLNQDNLKYIKKELKNKKSTQSTQSHEAKKFASETKSQQTRQAENERQKKVFEKYKNADEVAERDSRQQETLRETQIDDSVVDLSCEVNKPHDSKEYQLNEVKKTKTISQVQKPLKLHGLQPPLLAYKSSSKKSLSQKQFHSKAAPELKQLESKKLTIHKNNFLEYQLVSQASNTHPYRSVTGLGKQLSQQNDVNVKGIQFIEYLQSYIEDLNGTPDRVMKRRKTRDERSDSGEEVLVEAKNFKKNKVTENADQNMNTQQSQRNRFYPLSIKRPKQSQYVEFSSHREYERHSSHQQSPKIDEKKSLFSDGESQRRVIDQLKIELQKEKYYCTKLALQLQKYKQNEQRNRKQIQFLQKNIALLKVQVQNVKRLYEQELVQTDKLMSFVEMQQRGKQEKKTQKENYQFSSRQSSPQKSRSVYGHQRQNKFRNPLQAYQESSYNDLTRSTFENEFKQFMKFKSTEPVYSQLHPAMFKNMMREFQKGQQAYKSTRSTRNKFLDGSQNNLMYEFPGSENYLQNLINKQPSMKHSYNIYFSNFEESQQNEDKFMQKMLKNSISHRRKKPSHSMNSPASDNEDSKLTGSLEKLKRQYESFKAHVNSSNFPGKKNSKSIYTSKQVSPKQFSRIYAQ